MRELQSISSGDRKNGNYDYELALEYMRDATAKGHYFSPYMLTTMEFIGECDYNEIERFQGILFGVLYQRIISRGSPEDMGKGPRMRCPGRSSR